MKEISVGDQLDHYRIDSLVSRSSFSNVFRGTDLKTGTAVAIKVPHPEMETDPVFIERFHREEEIGEKFSHPGVMKVLADEDGERTYMVMEWIEGSTLRAILDREGNLPEQRCTRIGIGVCNALEYLHSHGVFHRDLKPENVMVDAKDHIKIIDFGQAAQTGARRITFTKITQAVGTPNYVSPEQVQGRRPDARSDVYSMGIILYEMLTGKVPFSGANPFDVLNARLTQDPTPPRQLNSAITPQMQEILFRALEREPIKRYATAREFAHDMAHPEEVGVDGRKVSRNRKADKKGNRNVLFYIAVAAIPIALFALLMLFAHWH